MHKSCLVLKLVGSLLVVQSILISLSLTDEIPPGTIINYKEQFVVRDKKAKHEVITREIFEHLVALAELELRADEAEYLRAELNDQLKAIRELESIDVPDDTPITSHGVPYSEATRPRLREDRIEVCPEADDIVRGAPDVDDRYIVVPEIPHEELE